MTDPKDLPEETGPVEAEAYAETVDPAAPVEEIWFDDPDEAYAQPPALRFDTELLRAAPGLAIVAATSWWNLATFTFKATVDASTYVTRRTLAGDSAGEIVAGAVTDLREVARRALGLTDDLASTGLDVLQTMANPDSTIEQLQASGAALLRRSASLQGSSEGHPAYARILTELAPDEARILRFLYLDGPQPSIDVRTGRPLGIGSQLIAGGMNMIAEHSGCRNPERIHPYLTNLNRLGMVQFSKEQVSDPSRYQLVEAQPKLVETIKKAGFAAKLVHRSIALTEFGREFCRLCLPPRSPLELT